MTIPVELLAKSPRGPKRLTLEQHLVDTEHAARRIFDPEHRWGQAFCRFFKIEDRARERFLLHVRVAALFHDIGKANEDFYAAVTQPGSPAQTLRHEHLSALVLHLPEVRGWLAGNKELDLEVITAAVLSHHLKASEKGDHQWGAPRGKEVLRLYLQHPQVTAILGRIGGVARLSGVPALPGGAWSTSPSAPWQPAWLTGTDAARKFGRDIAKNAARRTLLLATKAGVIIADSAASGLVREDHDITQWIDDVTRKPPITAEDVAREILIPRTEQIDAKRRAGGLGPFAYDLFQDRTAELGPRALLLAACGSGKTLAAWRWAEAQARERAIGKVIFLYPTRGTATEGFRDYVSWAPEADAALLHGTSRYELTAMQDNPSEGGQGKRFELSEAEARLFALGFWSRRYFSATVDQFLSFMEHGYTSLCLLPVLADAAVIIDEVHSFDRHLFETLVAFLKAFDVPVLCMTATLPPSRRNQLEAAGLRPYPTEQERAELEQLEKKERHPRYQLEPVRDAEHAFHEAVKAYREGKRVLWVVNQVARCQQSVRRLRAELGEGVLCYHSRFRLDDRQERHRETVSAFQQRDHAAIAVTTQVCEMSLDLDADVLITEIAPASSLVQRFGRANRHGARGDAFRARLLTYAPENPLPYTRADLDAAVAFLDSLGRGDISQRALAEALEIYAPREPDPDGSARFLAAGYYATPGALRDADASSTSCVLDSDLAAFEALVAAKKPTDGLILAVPRSAAFGEEVRHSFLPRYLRVAPGDRYDRSLGFSKDEGDAR